MSKRGRPPGANQHKRTVAFPPELYERIRQLAEREDRDVTAQILRMLRESLERHEGKAEKPGPRVPAALVAVGR